MTIYAENGFIYLAVVNFVKLRNRSIFILNIQTFTNYRSYISFDILRRVLSNYFGYDVLYVMNITDVDDKIIKSVRQKYLYQKYLKEPRNLNDTIDDAICVINYYEEAIKNSGDPDKKCLMQKTLDK